MIDLAPMDIALAVAAALAGLWAGRLHARSLRRVTDLLLTGRVRGFVLQLARFAALAGFLVLCGLAGAPVLVGGAAGVIIGRAWTIRQESA